MKMTTNSPTVTKPTVERIKWTPERIEAMRKDREEGGMSPEEVMKKWGTGNPGQYYALMKRHRNKTAVPAKDITIKAPAITPSDDELLGFVQRIKEAFTDKDKKIQELETHLQQLSKAPEVDTVTALTQILDRVKMLEQNSRPR